MTVYELVRERDGAVVDVIEGTWKRAACALVAADRVEKHHLREMEADAAAKVLRARFPQKPTGLAGRVEPDSGEARRAALRELGAIARMP